MVAALGRARTLSGREMKRARARSVDLGQAPQKPRMPLWPVYDPNRRTEDTNSNNSETGDHGGEEFKGVCHCHKH